MAGDHGSFYGSLEYGNRVYSEYPYDTFIGNTTITLQTSARITRGRRHAASMSVAFSVPMARLSYIAYFDPSLTTVTFGTSARLGESEPLSGQMQIAMNIFNGVFNVTHTMRGAFIVNTYYPLARFVMTRGYRINTTVNFGFVSNFTRSGSRNYAASMRVDFDWSATGFLRVWRPVAGNIGVVLTISSDEWIGPAWESPPDAMLPWIPEYPSNGPWIPIDPQQGPWIPITNARYFNG